jgi:hypothetical protein
MDAQITDIFNYRRIDETLVHCAANKRVTSFLGLYRVIRQNWEIETAFASMREIWEPNADWAPFIASMLAKQADSSFVQVGHDQSH